MLNLAATIKDTFVKHLNELEQMSKEELVNDRFDKFRHIGSVVE